MILKDFIYFSEHSKLDGNGTLCKLDNYDGDFNGYYQNHKVGLIICDKKVSNHLMINDKRYDINEIDRVDYHDNGSSRHVKLISYSGEIIAEFTYEVFWIDDLDMLEFAFELPEDEERDLLKYITNSLNNNALNQ